MHVLVPQSRPSSTNRPPEDEIQTPSTDRSQPDLPVKIASKTMARAVRVASRSNGTTTTKRTFQVITGKRIRGVKLLSNKARHYRFRSRIKKLPKPTNLVVRKRPFLRLAREVLRDYSSDVRLGPSAAKVLQEASEYTLVAYFEGMSSEGFIGNPFLS